MCDQRMQTAPGVFVFLVLHNFVVLVILRFKNCVILHLTQILLLKKDKNIEIFKYFIPPLYPTLQSFLKGIPFTYKNNNKK